MTFYHRCRHWSDLPGSILLKSSPQHCGHQTSARPALFQSHSEAPSRGAAMWLALKVADGPQPRLVASRPSAWRTAQSRSSRCPKMMSDNLACRNVTIGTNHFDLDNQRKRDLECQVFDRLKGLLLRR